MITNIENGKQYVGQTKQNLNQLHLPLYSHEAKSNAAMGVKYAPFFGSKTVAPSYLPSVVHALSSGMEYPISRAFPNKQEKHLICKQFNRNKYIVINDLGFNT